jgi:FkbM family methyltransferase
MKLKDLPRALGFGAGPREYSSETVTFSLPVDGEVRLARWLHPGETPKSITQESVDALRSFLHEGDVCIDIGAHTGDTTLPMALAVGPKGMVFALEPNPYVFKTLALNASLNPTKAHIVPLMFAAMPHDGEFEFEYSDEGYCNGGFHGSVSRWKHGHFSTLRVAGRNLAEYLKANAPDELPRIRYIKIDTEGYDRAVARSLAGLLREVRPYIKTEIYKHLSDDERDGYFDDLRRLGYRLFKTSGDNYMELELTPRDMTRWRHFDMFGVPQDLCGA